jgi:hypothetical protein
VATEDYTYFSGYDNLNNPVYWYSTQMPFLFLGSSLKESVSGFFIPGVDMPVWRTPVNWYLLDSPKQKEAMLFRMDIDRDQKNNIISSDLKGRDYCRDLMIRLMEETSAPEAENPPRIHPPVA